MSYTKTLTLEQTVARDILLVLLASFAIALSGKISIPLWFTPVPLATQNIVVLLFSIFLGFRRATAATFLFLFQGAMGLPVFSTPTGLFGPTAGYLIGYLIASSIVGYLAERSKTLANASLALLAGHCAIYLCGVSYLSAFLGFKKALLLGAAPFLIGDLLKTIAALRILKWARWNQ